MNLSKNIASTNTSIINLLKPKIALNKNLNDTRRINSLNKDLTKAVRYWR